MSSYVEYEAEAKKTIKNLKALKKKGHKEQTFSIDGMINYCNKVLDLCKIIKDLVKTPQK